MHWNQKETPAPGLRKAKKKKSPNIQPTTSIRGCDVHEKQNVVQKRLEAKTTTATVSFSLQVWAGILTKV